jgi:hypothetical protein
MVGETFDDDFFSSTFSEYDVDESLLPYDMNGNIRVVKMYWKSRRKIKKVK